MMGTGKEIVPLPPHPELSPDGGEGTSRALSLFLMAIFPMLPKTKLWKTPLAGSTMSAISFQNKQ